MPNNYLVVVWRDTCASARGQNATPKHTVTRDVPTLQAARDFLALAGRKGLRGMIVRGHTGSNPRVVARL